MESSKRPRARPTAAEMTTAAENRRQQTAGMEGFAALEARADDDPWLKDNPMARLGYRTFGGLEAVDYIPGLDNAGAVGAAGVKRGSSLNRAQMEAIRTLRPEQYEAWRRGETPYLVDPYSVLMGSEANSPPVRSHEFGHLGFDEVQNAIKLNPELAQRLKDAGLAGDVSYMFEEAMLERKDNPEDQWRGADSGTIRHLAEYDDQRRAAENDPRVARYEKIMQEIAMEELARRGEPSRAKRIEPRGGLLGIFDRFMKD